MDGWKVKKIDQKTEESIKEKNVLLRDYLSPRLSQ